MDSIAESSLLSKLESSPNLADIRTLFSNYLQPFNHGLASKKPSSKPAKTLETASLRSLAKHFLPFLNKSLSLLPKRLSSEAGSSCPHKISMDTALELFEVYRLCLNCLSLISSQLSCKPYTVQVQQVRLVHCLEAWGLYKEAETECFLVLETLRAITSGKLGTKSVKFKGQLVPRLNVDDLDEDFALLVVEIVITLVKCALMNPSKNEADYKRVIALIDEVTPWFKVLNANNYEKLHRALVGYLNRIGLYLVEELSFFHLELVLEFCKVTFSQYDKSSIKDQIYKFAWRLCCCLLSKKSIQVLHIIDMLKFVLSSLAAECKFNVEWTLIEFLEVVHNCARSCKTPPTVCSAVGEHLSRLAGSQAIPLVGPILGVYASGLLLFSSECHSIIGESASERSAKDGAWSGFSLHSEGLLQKLHVYLESLREFFNIGGNLFGLSKKASYLLSYYNALTFFCQPLAKFVYAKRREILAEGNNAAFIINLGVIQNAFDQLFHIFLHFTCAGEESDASDDNTKVILDVSVATLTLSLKTGHCIKESANLVKCVVTSDWVQADGLKYLFSSLYNVSVVLYRNKQLKEASKALKLSCKASWNLLVLHCKSNELPGDLSENSSITFMKDAMDFVNEASEKTAFLLDLLYERNLQKMKRLLKDSLESWSIAESMFKSVPPPLALVKRWVKIGHKLYQNKDAKYSPITLYNLLSSSVNVSKSALGVLLEQELLAYKLTRALDPIFSLKIRMEVINILLEKIYVTNDTYILKSRILIARGRELREFGTENLDECIQCLSDAISISEKCSGHRNCDSQALHLTACAYCLRALCFHETTEQNSKVLLLKSDFEDIHNALNLWLDPYQSLSTNKGNTLDDVFKFFNDIDHSNMLFEDMLKMLNRLLDLLSIKGYMEMHEKIYEILIRLFKWKKLPPEEAFAMFWKSRNFGHALCASPASEVFISKLLQHYGEISTSIRFWIKCMQPSQALLIGFQQKFFLTLPDSLQKTLHDKNVEVTCDKVKSSASGFTFYGSIEEVKLAASDLLSSVPVSGSAVSLAAHLYYDLCERLIMKGQVLEALSYAKEALQLRCELLKQKFRYSVQNPSESNSETEDGMPRQCHVLGSFQLHNSVANEAWFGGPPCDIEDCILTPWNVLQCYLESTLQVSKINEILGEASEAETLLQWGKEISLHQCLPLYVVSFSSMLGKLYCKQMLWELAEKELKAASQIMAENCNMISCLKCKMFLESTIDQQLGDLYRSHSHEHLGNPSVKMLSCAVENYRSAVQKLNFLMDDSASKFKDANAKQADYRARSSFFNCSVDTLDTRARPSKIERPDVKTQKKRSGNIKKDKKPSSLPGQCLVAGHNLRMTRSRYRSLERSCESTSSNVQCGPAVKSHNDNLFACNHEPYQIELASEAKTSIADCAYEITCLCNELKCWHCLVLEAVEFGSLTDFVHLNWELVRRRILRRLLIKIGKSFGACDDIHKAHQIILLSISLLVNPFCAKYSSVSWTSLIDLINEEFPRDVLAVEHAMLLYSICQVALQSYSNRFTRESCQISVIGIPRIFSWLKLAFALSCEVPLLCQQVSRLLTILYVLSTSVKAFSVSTSDALNESYWASFFHQASIGIHFNQQLFSSIMRKTKGRDMIALEGSCLSSSDSVFLGTLNSLRLTPESFKDMDEFVIRFFEGLPCTTIICISVIGGGDAILLREVLGCASSQAWILLSRLNSKNQPVIILLPLDSTLQDSSLDDGDSSSGISMDGKGFVKPWRCPWVSSVVDEVAPIFKTILKENYSSSAFQTEERLLWWSQRERLDNCLGKFLENLEDSWFGPWKYLLLGEWSDTNHMISLEKKLMDDLMLKCKVKVHKDLLKVILGSANNASEIRECGLQLILNNGCYIGGCCEAVLNASVEVKRLSIEVFNTIFETDALEETEMPGRNPVILVLDSEVQMLPWESLPVLRYEEVYRMPSVSSICATLDRYSDHQEQLNKHAEIFPVIDPLNSFYVLNPSGDLCKTQFEFENWFKDNKFEGKTGTAPTCEELVMALKTHDLFIYFGHGSGSQYIPGHKIQNLSSCAATLLMGCSSGSLFLNGCYAPNGTSLCYLLAGSPVIVANLWEVTDKDIDRFGKAMLDAWLRERSAVSVRCNECDELLDKFDSLSISRTRGIRKGKTSRNLSTDSFDVSVSNTCKHKPKVGSFMGQARNACNLPFLIGASPVCYGVPTGIAKKKRVVILSP